MIKGYQPQYGYTDNGNKYRKCTIGKKAGQLFATGGLAIGLVKAAKKPEVKASFKQLLDNLPNRAAKTKVGAIMIASYALAAAGIVGIYTLIGHGFDTIVNKISQNKADKIVEKTNTAMPSSSEKEPEKDCIEEELETPNLIPTPTMSMEPDITEEPLYEQAPIPTPYN